VQGRLTGTRKTGRKPLGRAAQAKERAELTDRQGVTIAIPNWNHEVLLPRSIVSALKAADHLRESGMPAEVLVLDDCSRDGSQTLLRQLEALYYEHDLRCLLFASNRGLGGNRNQTIKHARYRYIAFLDADNELVPANLPLFVRALLETGAAAAYGNLLVRTPSARFAHIITSNESFQQRMFEGRNYIDAFSVWDGVQLEDSGGYDPGCDRMEDYETWLHLATNGRRIVYVPIVLGYYYLLPQSLGADHVKETRAEARILRIYNQLKVRKFLQLNTCHLRFHPDLGYI
jgi:glycosyltransferase involved in cell wall biosynthesis